MNRYVIMFGAEHYIIVTVSLENVNNNFKREGITFIEI